MCFFVVVVCCVSLFLFFLLVGSREPGAHEEFVPAFLNAAGDDVRADYQRRHRELDPTPSVTVPIRSNSVKHAKNGAISR